MVGLRTLLVLMLCTGVAAAGPFPYDEHADARAEVDRAFARATETGRLVMIVFGANWCTDCRVLDATMMAEPLAASIETAYEVVKVDIGNWDKHGDVVARFNNPVGKGIPAMIIADAAGEVLFATRAGELATARSLGAEKLAAFFDALPRSRGPLSSRD